MEPLQYQGIVTGCLSSLAVHLTKDGYKEVKVGINRSPLTKCAYVVTVLGCIFCNDNHIDLI